MTPEEISNTRDDRFQDLCKLCENLGYRGSIQQLFNPNGSAVSSLINMLEDNPGAVRALIDWLADNHGEDLPECEKCGMVECECDDGNEEPNHCNGCDDSQCNCKENVIE